MLNIVMYAFSKPRLFSKEVELSKYEPGIVKQQPWVQGQTPYKLMSYKSLIPSMAMQDGKLCDLNSGKF